MTVVVAVVVIKSKYRELLGQWANEQASEQTGDGTPLRA
jgi:hypothetical protein